MDLQSLLATDLRLLEPLCDIIHADDYVVYRSDRFPHFYGANGIAILRNGGRTLHDWERLFADNFEPERFGHRTFTFLKQDDCMPLVQAAREAGYDKVQIGSFMTAEPLVFEGGDSERPVRRVESEDDWTHLRRFHHEAEREESWYTPEGCDRLVDKTRFVSEAVDIHWLYLQGTGADHIAAVLGVFLHNGTARLQDVMTHPGYRRRGLASQLLRYVRAYAGERLGADRVALYADNEYFAYQFYSRAGFVPVGETVELMNYPERRP